MNKKKEYRAVILSGLFVLLAMAAGGGVYAGVFLLAGLPMILSALIGIATGVLMIAMIYTVVTRIKEIKEGEEDDLSEY